jgi:hypothetical protein
MEGANNPLPQEAKGLPNAKPNQYVLVVESDMTVVLTAGHQQT